MPSCCKCGCKKQVQYPGSYRAGHQPAGTNRDPSGEIKASSDKWNPINSAKKQKVEREAAEERIAQMPGDEKQLTQAGAGVVAKEIMESVGDGWPTHGCAVEEYLCADNELDSSRNYFMAFYIGYTARGIEEEALCWLTKRGNSRPVLLWADGSTITMGDAQTKLGFTFHTIYESTLKINARDVEGALQKRYQHLKLGQRLWRCADMGVKYDTPEDVGKLHKVFVAFSPDVKQMLANGEIKVNH